MGGFEGGIRVPAVISYPARGWSGGKRLEHSTSMMDLYPTIMAQAQIKPDRFRQTFDNKTNHLGMYFLVQVIILWKIILQLDKQTTWVLFC